ncbi:MAG: hypothetical protein SFW36_17085, partial [Leptolyngbyaceae cyanobacterium bins.59]|nr:hypothetical protein [Leptolyngbyaceae cyanobacterium bins.59]
AYYAASSALAILPQLQSPTLILYAIDDPLFDPTIVSDLESIRGQNSALEIWLTRYGGHVGYFSDRPTQIVNGDLDPWWAWNRILDWMEERVCQDRTDSGILRWKAMID